MDIINCFTQNIDKLEFISSKLGSIYDFKINTIMAIINNYELFEDLTRVNLYLTDNPISAIESTYNEGIVVYFEQIELYCSTNHETYTILSNILFTKKYNVGRNDIIDELIEEKRHELKRMLTSDELEEIRNSDIKLKFVTMSQIVLTTEKQKIIFAFNSNDVNKKKSLYDTLRKITKEEYGVTSVNNIFEITMFNKIFNNKEDADKFVRDIKKAIDGINKEFGRLIQIIQPINIANIDYCKYNIDNLLVMEPTNDRVMKILKTIPKVNNLILNMGYIGSNIMTNNSSQADDNLQSIIDHWVATHPIIDRIKPSDHVKLFNEQNNTNISVSSWGKYVKNLVISFKSNGGYYYKNK